MTHQTIPQPDHTACRPAGRPRFAPALQTACAALAGGLIAVTGGCNSGMDEIDRRVDALLMEASEPMTPDAATPRIARQADHRTVRPERDEHQRVVNTSPSTTSPAADELSMRVSREAEDVIDRLSTYGEVSPDAVRLDLHGALAFAASNAPEFRTAQEELVLTSLRLLTERHRWGPRFFDEVGAQVNASGDDGFFESSMQLVNELGVSQRLPYGGEISASALAVATEQLHSAVSEPGTQSAEIILQANLPLLRGAGYVARENLIQAEREMIYSARDFERFRREFFFDIARDYLSLVVQKQSIVNAERQLASFELLERRERAHVRSGRQPPFVADQAAQNTNFARDGLINQRESFRLTEDRFKLRIGMPPKQAIEVPIDVLELPVPEIGLNEAVEAAMRYRLDLQTRRDVLDDVRRSVYNARNNLLGDLQLAGQVVIPTDDDKNRAGAQFRPDDSDLSASITYGLPLDREIERLALRQAQIRLQREIREYERFRDNIAVEVRAAVRDIDRARYSLQLQEEDIRIAERRQASIDAAPDRAEPRDRSEAVDDLLRAEDQRDQARRDVQVAILNYLLVTGQLRVDAFGRILPPQELQGTGGEPVSEDEATDATDVPDPDLAPLDEPAGTPEDDLTSGNHNTTGIETD